MKKYKQNSKLVSTKRNKGIEPISLGENLIMGYNKEIHEDDSIEFTYKLPLGAIKRLIKSYYEDILSIYQDSVYLGQTGSWEIRMKPYCFAMVNNIEKQLNKRGLEGEKIIQEIYDQYFKAANEEMKRFNRNHGMESLEDCKPCNDSKCVCKHNSKKGT